jgi:hypothetical protein
VFTINKNQCSRSQEYPDGKKATSKSLRTDHMAREIEQLKKKLSQAQAVIDLQKKVSELLGTHILSHDSSEVS